MKKLARVRYMVEWSDGVLHRGSGIHTTYRAAVKNAKALCAISSEKAGVPVLYGQNMHVVKLTVLR